MITRSSVFASLFSAFFEFLFAVALLSSHEIALAEASAVQASDSADLGAASKPARENRKLAVKTEQSTGEDRGVGEIPIRCGANALYMLIRLQGGDVEFTAVANELEQRVTGNSILELREASGRLGYPAVIEKREDFQFAPGMLPVIAFTNNGIVKTKEGIGHFVVVLSVTSDRVVYLDGTTAQRLDVKKSWFTKGSPGHIVRLAHAEYRSNLSATAIRAIAYSAPILLLCLSFQAYFRR